MATPRGFSNNGKSYYTNVTTPQDVHVQFTVTPTNGLGVTSVKSNGYVRNVFMYTSTTPTANNGFTNPNPAAGYFAVQFNNNFNYYLSNLYSVRAPGSGSDIKIDNSAMTAGVVYIITTLGDATAAKWVTIGVPSSVTPAVGVSFVALTDGGAGNALTSRVQVAASPNVYGLEMVGNPGIMQASSNIASYGGAWVLGRFVAPTFTAGAYTPAGTIAVGAYTPTGTVAAPVFTGGALGTHTHSIPAGTDSGGGTSGATSAGTPAGTNSAPAFTGAAASLTATFTGSAGSLSGTLAFGAAAPTTGSVVSMLFKWDGSSVTIDGI